MNMLWQMIIAIEEKSKSILLEYGRHTSKFNQKLI